MKKNRVAFVDKKIKNAFEELKNGKSEEKDLAKLIDKALDELEQNPLVGTRIPSNLWPKEYLKKYQITNLLKYDLKNGWRLIYTIKGNEVEILSIILEWFSHKDYERRFGYKRS